jgi:hypothetical protein
METKDFKSMTHQELQDYCDDNNIEVQSAKQRPTVKELLKAIEDFNSSKQDDAGVDVDPEAELDDVDEFLDTSYEEPKAKKAKKNGKQKETREQKRKRLRKELMKLNRVMIISNDHNQTGINTQAHYCTWGNRLVGHHTDIFVLNKPWHLREGALRNLENMTISKSIQDDEGNTVRFETVPAYTIKRLPDLTKEELNQIAKRQRARDAALGKEE